MELGYCDVKISYVKFMVVFLQIDEEQKEGFEESKGMVSRMDSILDRGEIERSRISIPNYYVLQQFVVFGDFNLVGDHILSDAIEDMVILHFSTLDPGRYDESAAS